MKENEFILKRRITEVYENRKRSIEEIITKNSTEPHNKNSNKNEIQENMQHTGTPEIIYL